MNAAEYAWWAVTGQRLPPRRREPVALVGWPTAKEGQEMPVVRCCLCSERVFEHETVHMWCEPLLQRATLCMACAEECDDENIQAEQREDYADALAAREERDR